ILVNASSVMTLVVDNNSVGGITSIAFSDPFPAGMVVAPAPGFTSTCGGTPSGNTAGSTTFSLTGGAIAAAGGSCTITMNVTSATAGSYANQTNGATSSVSATPGPRSNIATLTVNLSPPTVAKSFAASPVGINTDVVMTVTLTNPNT